MNHPYRRLVPAAVTTAVLTSTLMACTGPDQAVEGTTDLAAGTVVRVIDGDTLVINFEGSDQTVRLLNVDTPETKHPDKPVECLGPEATRKLEALTPPGTQVALDFDVEREDKFDRVLAAVFTDDKTLVNAEIARVGLGVPVLIEPNSKYYDEVQAAYNEATAGRLGLLDPNAGCTLPAEVSETLEELSSAAEAPAGETATAVAATAAGLLTALTAAKALRQTLQTGEDTVRVIAVGADRSAAIIRDLDAQITKGERALTVANDKAEAIQQAEAAAQRKKEEAKKAAAAEAARVEAARIEAERIQAEANARAEAERIAAEAAAAAEQERIRDLPPAPAPYVPPAPAPAPAPPAAQNPYPGYNGPRCYAPGGQIWRPC